MTEPMEVGREAWPAHEDQVEQAVAALQRGLGVIIVDDRDREGEGDIAFAASHCTPELVALCVEVARGLLCVALTERLADRLGIERLHSNGRDPLATPFGMPISRCGIEHAVSVQGRSATIRATAAANTREEDFVRPGHVSTLIAHPAGVRGRCGHTEAVTDLLALAGIPGPGVLCEILGADGGMAMHAELKSMSDRLALPMVEVRAIREALTGGFGR